MSRGVASANQLGSAGSVMQGIHRNDAQDTLNCSVSNVAKFFQDRGELAILLV